VGDLAEAVVFTGDGFCFDGEDEAAAGSVDKRSINCLSFSLSRSSCPEATFALSRSIWFNSWAPSDRRLLTKVSTFFFKLSTVSVISV
jgi:hypothetical protein